MKLFIKLIIIFTTICFIFSNITFAHPGRTAGDGCHYCRTNCNSRGVAQNARHCHGGSTSYTPPPIYTKPQPVYTPQDPIIDCQDNAYYSNSEKTCVCNNYYVLDGGICIKIPSNANVSIDGKAWFCRYGYEKLGEACVEQTKTISLNDNSQATSEPSTNETRPTSQSISNSNNSEGSGLIYRCLAAIGGYWYITKKS